MPESKDPILADTEAKMEELVQPSSKHTQEELTITENI